MQHSIIVQLGIYKQRQKKKKIAWNKNLFKYLLSEQTEFIKYQHYIYFSSI